ncbi:beta-1,3-galactosyl-O-glycosyl-glycoprotein beta-1,6-N-acetylglucosaminyltransferase 3 [Lepisosteus oculatus]|uniref:beta-1,3-galactosyl-O-glycosyl-glycoprotein beta-1,6-N-acetylglucosaminyltransferase 3 n=1 Tax=Lepisosteus oculatus TaxID=7918 RepID=UPI003724454F
MVQWMKFKKMTNSTSGWKRHKFTNTAAFSFICLSFTVILWQTKKLTCPLDDLHPRKIRQLEEEKDILTCSRIIQGDTEAIEEALRSRILVANKKKPLTEAYFLSITRNCEAYVQERKFITFPLSKEEKDFPIAYSMVVHEKIEMFERLLRAIYTPQNVYCVHVDRKSSEEFKNAVKAIASCFPNVFLARKLEKVIYATWSRVQADLNCMEDLLNSTVQWRYLLNTCGTDFPIKTNLEIVHALKALNGRNSLESESTPRHKKDRWLYHYEVKDHISRTETKKSPPPIGSPMFSGNAYFVVTRDFVKHVFENPETQKLLEWEKDTYSPDEHLWATLQRMSGVPGSNPINEKFHTTDMIAIARLVKWEYLEGDIQKGSSYPRCTGVHRRSVCVYGSGDLHWMLHQHHLFANKFDPEVDDTAIKCLEVYLRLKALHNRDLHVQYAPE